MTIKGLIRKIETVQMVHQLSFLSNRLAVVNTHDELVNTRNTCKRTVILEGGFTTHEKDILHSLGLDNFMEKISNLNNYEDCWRLSKELIDVVRDKKKELPLFLLIFQPIFLAIFKSMLLLFLIYLLLRVGL